MEKKKNKTIEPITEELIPEPVESLEEDEPKSKPTKEKGKHTVKRTTEHSAKLANNLKAHNDKKKENASKKKAEKEKLTELHKAMKFYEEHKHLIDLADEKTVSSAKKSAIGRGRPSKKVVVVEPDEEDEEEETSSDEEIATLEKKKYKPPKIDTSTDSNSSDDDKVYLPPPVPNNRAYTLRGAMARNERISQQNQLKYPLFI